MANWKGIVGAPHTIESFERYVKSITMHEWRPDGCVLHNTGVPRFRDWHSVPGPTRMTGLERYYRDVQGWSAGPHAFVADDFVWLFTPLWLPGVHSPSWNRTKWGIEMVGDWDSEPLNARVYDNATSVIAILNRFLNQDPAQLRYHKEDPKTTHYGCPGKATPPKARTIEIISAKIVGGSNAISPNFSGVDNGGSAGVPVDIEYPTIGRGSKNKALVLVLQGLLGMKNINAPGTFGPRTEQAVKDFQSSHGLDADGIVGRDTWRKLKRTIVE